ncbi:uncharacterized protein LOC112163980 [Rosa chinensis]|uniref:uncharacterized protein LOC112163980 n=1 Tax=Rosa chinensis TaxID=74649 RepID=UPI000D094635|nr:uncharacterized protein LOC112163980 [Rosa chinensis]
MLLSPTPSFDSDSAPIVQELTDVNSAQANYAETSFSKEEGEFTPVLSKKAKKQLKYVDKAEKSKGKLQVKVHVRALVQKGAKHLPVYAQTTIAGRRLLWQDLRLIAATLVHGPWLVFGDFNCVIGAHEKRGGIPPSLTSCLNFQDICSDYALMDIPTRGLSYTWTDRRIYVRLDRALGNVEWLEAWESLEYRALAKAFSDHCPLLVTCSDLPLLRSLLSTLEACGCSMKEQTKIGLEEIQQLISVKGPSVERLSQESAAHARYQEALNIQAIFWKEKSRLRWLVDGDRNTAFLHNMVKVRRLKQSISSLRVGRQILRQQLDIENHAVQHFSSTFSHDNKIIDTGLVERVIPRMVTDEENAALLALPLGEEIKATVFSMDGSSAPGPDGFSGAFYQSCWDVVSSDVISMVKTYLSVLINGQSGGFFTCSRGVRQGDQLSPLLFGLAEEVLSRGITRLAVEGKLTTIAAPRSVKPPTHVLFADDVMVFLQGNSRSIRALMKFMVEYARNSGHVVNKAKSSVYLGKFSRPREIVIQHLLGIREGKLPFTYLRVPIFQGRPKQRHLQHIVDKIRCKLTSWKGGLGVKNIFSLNQALLLKRCWEVAEGSSTSTIFLKDRFLKAGLHPKLSSLKSSIWLGLKKQWNVILQKARWLIGNGLKVNFWTDNWMGRPLIDFCYIDASLRSSLREKVSDFIVDHQWVIPQVFTQLFPLMAHRIRDISLPFEPLEDQLVWLEVSSGKLTARDAYEAIRLHHPLPE